MPKTLRGSFEQALRPLPSVVKGVQACRLPGLKCLKRCAAASSRHSSHCPSSLPFARPQMPKTLRGSFEQALRPLPSVVKGVQACRLPGLKRSAAASTRHSGHCPLLLGAVSVSVCLPVSVRLSASLSACQSFCLPASLPVCLSVCLCLCQCRSVSINAACLPACLPAQACRLPGLKCLKRCAAASSRHSGHCPLLLRAFKPAVCQASNA